MTARGVTGSLGCVPAKPDQGFAWITGASSGIGRALALRLARAGWRVAASARRAAELESLATEAEPLAGSIRAMPLDVTDAAAVRAALQETEAALGPVALAVLNAGTHKPVRAEDFTAGDARGLLDLNVMGTVNCLEALLPPMIARRQGQIAVVASLAGYFGLPTSAVYGASKAGLINMAEALKPELDGLGVQLQLVCPGFVRTPLTDKNDFPMPFLMELEEAAEAFYRGLRSERFEIVFPRRLAYLMKAMRLLPYPVFFALTRRMIPRDKP